MNKSSSDIQQFIVDWITGHRGFAEHDIDVSADIFAEGYVDSLSMFRLILEIENYLETEVDQNYLFEQERLSIVSISSLLG